MAIDQKQKFCRRCRKMTLHQRHRTSELAGCFLTLITGGFFLPIWIIMSMIDTGKGYRCNQCGERN